jgi:Rad3-related DNA helicase
VKSTSDGSRSDLAWVPPPHVWEHVMSETDTSLKLNCEHYHECFYYQAKRSASNADIVVANHHLFFADLAVRRETGNYQQDLVIPAYSRVIFDEAHHLEDVASDYFGVRVTRLGLQARLSRLLSPKDHNRGAIPGPRPPPARGSRLSRPRRSNARTRARWIEARERRRRLPRDRGDARSLRPARQGTRRERDWIPRVALAADSGAAETARSPRSSSGTGTMRRQANSGRAFPGSSRTSSASSGFSSR